MKYSILILLFTIPGYTYPKSDTLRNILTLENYMELIVANHPVVRQAKLYDELAEARILKSKGSFDPRLNMNYDVKNFKNQQYYELFSSTLKFQTWLPIDPKISVDRNRGDYLNPENSIPEINNDLQISAGISIPLGKGLIIDERRLALKQADLFQNIASAEKIKIINKIMMEALGDYWEWYLSYRKLLLFEQSKEIANELFNRVKGDFTFGEASEMDTIQARITYETRLADYEKVRFELESSRLMISQHLWSPDIQPLELKTTTLPDTTATFGTLPPQERINNFMDWALENHPDIQVLKNQNQQLQVAQKWNRESLKPEFNINYSLLDAPITPTGDFTSPAFNDNYKLGIDFSIPILLRKERANIQINQISMLNNEYTTSNKELEIKNNILKKYAETKMSQNLTTRYESIADNYDRLLSAELVNLQNGESDLFKINIQQDKLIESKIKYLDNLVKFQKNKAELFYEVGVPLLDPGQVQ